MINNYLDLALLRLARLFAALSLPLLAAFIDGPTASRFCDIAALFYNAFTIQCLVVIWLVVCGFVVRGSADRVAFSFSFFVSRTGAEAFAVFCPVVVS